MNKICFCFFLISAFLLLSQAKLAQVVSIFRHGARYPLSSIYDGNDTRYLWGELSSTGMHQHETLGSILRKQYIENLGFLSTSYDSNEMEVYSTAINRTIQSVESQLYGLYPAGSGTRLQIVENKYYLPPYSNKSENPQRNFVFPNGHQIIPIKFDQKVMKDNCDHQLEEMQKNTERQMPVYEEMNLTYYPFVKKMAQLFNLTGNVTLSTMQSLHQAVQIDLHLNRPLPTGFTEDDMQNLKHLDSWNKQFVWNFDLAKAANKYKLEKVMGMFDSRIKNPGQAMKWSFLSGHDTDIAPLYTDLNLSSSQCIQELYRKGQTAALNCEQVPLFASSLIFELYTSGNSNTIKIRSNGNYMNLCGKKETECKYEDWKKLVQANLASQDLATQICGKYNFEALGGDRKGLFSFKMPLLD